MGGQVDQRTISILKCMEKKHKNAKSKYTHESIPHTLVFDKNGVVE